MPEYNVVGYNYRMTDLQEALGVAQMGELGILWNGVPPCFSSETEVKCADY